MSHPLLWTRLGCANVDKTRVYINRSKSSPLEICLGTDGLGRFCKGAFLATVPHLGRLKTLSVFERSSVLQVLVGHFSRPFPLLRVLKIGLAHKPTLTLPSTFSNGDLSSLCELILERCLMPLSWRGLENLTTFHLSHIPEGEILLAHFLVFFESAPRLHHIRLHYSIPNSPNSPPERLLSLPHLKKLSILMDPLCFVLLNHLSIPSGASVVLQSHFSGARSPILDHLPKPLDNFHNLSHITVMNLCFGPDQRAVKLNGPSGELYASGCWERECVSPYHGTNQLLWFLNRFDTSRCQLLRISQYSQKPHFSRRIVAWATYQFLLPMCNLQTFALTHCNNLPFILTLNPDKNPSGIVLCPTLGEIILWISRSDELHIDELLNMVQGRASS